MSQTATPVSSLVATALPSGRMEPEKNGKSLMTGSPSWVRRAAGTAGAASCRSRCLPSASDQACRDWPYG